MRRPRPPAVLAALVIGGCGDERPANTDAKQTATRRPSSRSRTGADRALAFRRRVNLEERDVLTQDPEAIEIAAQTRNTQFGVSGPARGSPASARPRTARAPAPAARSSFRARKRASPNSAIRRSLRTSSERLKLQAGSARIAWAKRASRDWRSGGRARRAASIRAGPAAAPCGGRGRVRGRRRSGARRSRG